MACDRPGPARAVTATARHAPHWGVTALRYPCPTVAAITAALTNTKEQP